MKTKEAFKKEFKKVVKTFRDNRKLNPDINKYRAEFPKAIMTASQFEKGIATINCDYFGVYEVTELINYEPLVSLITKYDIEMSVVDATTCTGKLMKKIVLKLPK